MEYFERNAKLPAAFFGEPEHSLEESGRLEREGEALTGDLLALVEDLRRFPDDPAAPLPPDALSSASTSRLSQQSAAPPAGTLLSSPPFSQSGATWASAAGAAVGVDSSERSALDSTFGSDWTANAYTGLAAGEDDGARRSAEVAGIAHPQRSYSTREPRSGRGDRSVSPPGSRGPAGELPDEHSSRSATLPLPGRRAAGLNAGAGELPAVAFAGGSGGALVVRDSRSLAQSGRSQSRHSLGPLIENDSFVIALGSSGDGTSSNGTSSGVSSANDSVRRANRKSATASSAFEQEACALSLLDSSHVPQIRGAAGAPGASGRSPQHQRDRMMQLFSRTSAGGVGADGVGSQLPLHLSSADARVSESLSDMGVGYRFDTVDAERAPSETSSHELTLDELVERNSSATSSSLSAERADRARRQTPASERSSNTGGPLSLSHPVAADASAALGVELSSSTALGGAAGYGVSGGPNGTRISSGSSTAAASTASAGRPITGDYLGLGLGSGSCPRPGPSGIGGAIGAPRSPLASGAPTDTDALVMERTRDGPSWTFLLKGIQVYIFTHTYYCTMCCSLTYAVLSVPVRLSQCNLLTSAICYNRLGALGI